METEGTPSERAEANAPAQRPEPSKQPRWTWLRWSVGIFVAVLTGFVAVNLVYIQLDGNYVDNAYDVLGSCQDAIQKDAADIGLTVGIAATEVYDAAVASMDNARKAARSFWPWERKPAVVAATEILNRKSPLRPPPCVDIVDAIPPIINDWMS